MNSLNQIIPYYLPMLMIVVGYGTKGLAILISNTCNISTSREWSLDFPTFIFPKEFVKDVFLENILKRSLKKGRLRGPPLPWSSSIVIWWDPFPICPLARRVMCLHLLMISHDILGCIFSAEIRSSWASQRLQSTCRESVYEKDQNPMHKKWGGICEHERSTSLFRCSYTVPTYNTI